MSASCSAKAWNSPWYSSQSGAAPPPAGLELSESWRFERAFRTQRPEAIGTLAAVPDADLAESIEGRIVLDADGAEVDVRLGFPGGRETRIAGTSLRRR
ncbi:MAG: hypothetical protein AAGH15_01460 [Myxococcota bacterium]